MDTLTGYSLVIYLPYHSIML